jgi:peptide/nickel transport system substrate-binding protein
MKLRRASIRPKARIAAIAISAIGAFALSGCGDSSSSVDRRTLRGTYSSFPDHLDPALSATLEGWTAMYNTYIPLLTYAHADGAAGTRLIPGLAKSLPKITDGGRTYTLFLRPGLKYSDGTLVRASDFTSTVERLFRVNSPGSVFYADIVGAERFAATRTGGIPGIRANDRTGEIEISLVEPRGTFSNELGTLYVALVPPQTPDESQTQGPPPATGPYEITNVEPGRSWEYRRNPVWSSVNAKAMPGFPSGHVDAIEMEVISNPSTQVNEVMQGRSDWMKNQPPPDRYAEIESRYGGTQFRSEPTISNFYFWMNTTRRPFTDLRVRRAVNYAINPAALERIYAGTLRRTQQILPPDMPGYSKFEPYPHSPTKARQLIAEADPADRDITIWTNNEPPADQAGEYYQGVLKWLGFNAKLKVVDGASYFTVIGNRAAPDLDTGWANWLLDYPHPNDYFEPQLTGGAIQPVNSTNYARFDDPALSKTVSRLGAEQLGPSQEAEYAALDRAFMKQAPWAPFGTLTLATFVSEAIDLDSVIVSPIFGQDLTSFRFD